MTEDTNTNTNTERAQLQTLAQSLTRPEPPPQSNAHPAVWPCAIRWAQGNGASPTVIALMTERHEQGAAKYGVPLQPHNGREVLTDLTQELLDAIAYAMQAVLETPPETARRTTLKTLLPQLLDNLNATLCTMSDPDALKPPACLTRAETRAAFVEEMGASSSRGTQ